MMNLISFVPVTALLTSLAGAAIVPRSAQKGSDAAGSTVKDVFPPTGTAADPTAFPDESKVGFVGTTLTGAEPLAIATAASYPDNQGEAGQFPLVAPLPEGVDASSNFDIKKYWGNLSPWYTVSSADYGLPDASPLLPEGCDIVQVHLLYRHGARYPTAGAAPATFASKVHNATSKGFTVKGELSFLADWTYKLGAELLTPFGRTQNFLLGVEHRQLYGHLLNNFTAAGTIPVFRTESQDRMVKTANNFAAGFFGVPEYLDQVNIEILVENSTVNNSGAPYEVCTNANVADLGSIGNTVATEFATNAFNDTLARLNSQISGLEFTPTDAIAMLQLCSYETNALGYSKFCGLFSQEDYIKYEYYFDLLFYYNNGPGSPVAAAQGKAYLEEFVARFAQKFPTGGSSALNSTFDDSWKYFPLNQSIYADATHEVVVLDTLMAFNLTAIFNGPPLHLTGDRKENSFVASKVVPFATHFTVQVLECPAYQPTKQVRFLVNDAVVPVYDSYSGCEKDPNGLCSFDHVVSVLQKRIEEIDYDYDCFGNFTAEAGVDYNGRAPKSS